MLRTGRAIAPPRVLPRHAAASSVSAPAPAAMDASDDEIGVVSGKGKRKGAGKGRYEAMVEMEELEEGEWFEAPECSICDVVHEYRRRQS